MLCTNKKEADVWQMRRAQRSTQSISRSLTFSYYTIQMRQENHIHMMYIYFNTQFELSKLDLHKTRIPINLLNRNSTNTRNN